MSLLLKYSGGERHQVFEDLGSIEDLVTHLGWPVFRG